MKLHQKLNLFVLALLTLACITIQAQSPSRTLRPARHQEAMPMYTPPAGCATNCIWYSGDFDSSNVNANGLYNGYTPNNGNISAETWVPFLPVSSASAFNAVEITSVTFNELVYGTPSLTSMTYGISSNVSNGNAGNSIASGTCASTSVTATGRSGFGLTEFAFTCTLPTPVTLSTNYLYWVNLLPDIANESSIYLSNAIDSPELHHIGWGNVYNNSYFNSSYFEVNYMPATDQAYGMEAFSVAMTGKYTFIRF